MKESWRTFNQVISKQSKTTKIDCLKESGSDIVFGVPQGLCLGLLLFLVYINYLLKAVQCSTVSMYADDTCLKSKDISQLNRAMNRDLEDLGAWLKGNKLSLNFVKTQSM